MCRQLGHSEEGTFSVIMIRKLILSSTNVTLSGAEAVSQSNQFGSSALQFLLDDVGYNGSETNLLDCLPEHNCESNNKNENAGVQCVRKGE